MDSQINKRVVCARCARIKQACDGAAPCSRCKRLGVACEPNDPGAKVSSRLNTAAQPVKITRTHSGCLTCKKRRRKCDEARPKCSDCRRLCLDCTYPEVRRKVQTAASALVAPTLNRPDGLSLDSATESQTPTDDGVEFDADILDDNADNTSWSDVNEPWPDVSQSCMVNYASDTGNTPSPNADLPRMMISAAPDIDADEDKYLLNHYMKVVAGVLSRRDDQRSNPYLTKVLPMAFSNELVMDAVLALSANHWKKLQPTVWKRGTIHQTNALQGLAKLLPHLESDSADVALSATLLLGMIELFDGTSSHWKFHLDGARRLLSAFGQKPGWSKRTEYRTFYRQLYHYLDSATTISTCHPPLLEAPKDEPSADGTPCSDSSRYNVDYEEALYGVPKALFHFVDKLNSLAYQRKFREDPVFENMFRASADSLEKELERWSQEHKAKVPPYESGSLPDEEAAKQATTAFEQALQLRLHQIVNGYSLDHTKVQQCVSRILEAVQEIRYGSPMESSLVFPLVMAGGACSTEGERLIIRNRFLIMERTLGFRYIYTAHDLVQRVWKEREVYTGTDKEVNWAAIRYFQIPGLALV